MHSAVKHEQNLLGAGDNSLAAGVNARTHSFKHRQVVASGLLLLSSGEQQSDLEAILSHLSRWHSFFLHLHP